jgi:hypothetical protein
MSPDIPRGTGKSIGGEQRRFELMQLLHHNSVGHQSVHTRISLAKKAISLQAN